MIRDLQQDKRDFKLIYCTRSPEMIAFRDELSSPELAGEPEHRDFILDDDEKGEIMICISRAKSDELVLDI